MITGMSARFVVFLTLVLVTVAFLSTHSYGQAQPAPVLRFIGFSTRFPPGDGLACRQAISYGLDREAVAKAVAPHLRQIPRPAVGIQHPSLPGRLACPPAGSRETGRS